MTAAKHQNSSKTSGRIFSQSLNRPQGAPRGLLRIFILHQISIGPTHGYEISQFIEEKTQGAWRPGAGSVYPTLKKLEREGLIRTTAKSKDSENSQQIYEITPEGSQCLREGKDVLSNAGRRWSAMRGIFFELMDPSHLSTFLVEGSKSHFQMAQEFIDSKISKLSPNDAEFTLREYALTLERQLKWTKTRLEQFEKSEAPTPKLGSSRRNNL